MGWMHYILYFYILPKMFKFLYDILFKMQSWVCLYVLGEHWSWYVDIRISRVAFIAQSVGVSAVFNNQKIIRTSEIISAEHQKAAWVKHTDFALVDIYLIFVSLQ